MTGTGSLRGSSFRLPCKRTTASSRLTSLPPCSSHRPAPLPTNRLLQPSFSLFLYMFFHARSTATDRCLYHRPSSPSCLPVSSSPSSTRPPPPLSPFLLLPLLLPLFLFFFGFFISGSVLVVVVVGPNVNVLVVSVDHAKASPHARNILACLLSSVSSTFAPWPATSSSYRVTLLFPRYHRYHRYHQQLRICVVSPLAIPFLRVPRVLTLARLGSTLHADCAAPLRGAVAQAPRGEVTARAFPLSFFLRFVLLLSPRAARLVQ